MRGVNKVVLLGNIGRDPEIRYTADERCIANLSLVTVSTWMDNGKEKEEKEWHRVVVFGKRAEVVRDYVKKGSCLYVEGRNKTRKYKDKDSGQDRYITEVVVDHSGDLQMTPNAKRGD